MKQRVIKPKLPHRIDIYLGSVSKSGGGILNTLPASPNFASLPAFVQPEISVNSDEYAHNKLCKTAAIFICNATAFAAIDTNTRIVFAGTQYRVSGTKENDAMGIIFRVEVEVLN